MNSSFHDRIETSRRKLLDAVAVDGDVAFIRIHGNIGDELIYAGTRRLLSTIRYRELSVRNLDEQGEVAVVAGGGSWCNAYHALPDYLRQIEQRYEQVIVLPSSFDVSVEIVREVLSTTNALVFARERESYNQIRDLCNAELAHDCAVFFDFTPYVIPGKGTLNAFRTDREAGPYIIPEGNNDISGTCESLDEWLWTIARYDTIQTDRAHVIIAAALLGKKVRYRPSNYHKVPAIVEYTLSEFAIERLDDDKMLISSRPDNGVSQETGLSADDTWSRQRMQALHEIAGIVPWGEDFILVDDDLLGPLPLARRRSIPFLERGGRYWGPPKDDETAIREFERLLDARPAFMVFAWPAFWWLDCYPGLHALLRNRFCRVLENERLVVFKLKR